MLQPPQGQRPKWGRLGWLKGLIKCLLQQSHPVVMYGYENWTVKKVEHRRIDAFELLEKTLESPLDSKEIQRVHPKGNKS